MSAKEKGMARLLARTGRAKRIAAVIAQIDLDTSTILDLGCGIGALTTSLAKRFPSALVVGIDKSKYLLNKLQKKKTALTILGDISTLPLKDEFFDVVVAVQVLHEILSSKGAYTLVATLKNIRSRLNKDGEFIIFDHANPGDTPVFLELSKEMFEKLCEFQSKFKFRRITFQKHDEGLIRISMQDFYDFITKIWALNSELEEEEMNETHTPFTRQELMKFLKEAGFNVKQMTSLTPVYPRRGITIKSEVKLPDRHVILAAKSKS